MPEETKEPHEVYVRLIEASTQLDDHLDRMPPESADCGEIIQALKLVQLANELLDRV